MAIRTHKEKEDELLWVKLQGDWTNANYRCAVAKKGLCLEILAEDINRAVSGAAHQKIIHTVMKEIQRKDV